MLEFEDLPYEYVGPDPRPWMIWCAGIVIRLYSLPHGVHQLKKFTIENPEALDAITDGSKRILFLPNHSTHSDPQVMFEVQRRLKRPSLFMAAYDVFLRSKITRYVMQKSGAFSVDRDSSDKESMKTAIETMVAGKYALTIFPEGNVFFMNDRPGPFVEGAAYMAMSAQKKLGEEVPIYAVPVSIKASHLTDQRATVRQMIQSVADAGGTDLSHVEGDLNKLKTAGIILLRQRLQALGYEVPDLGVDHIRESLDRAAELVMVQIEEEMEQKVRPNQSLTDRAKALRRSIHKIRMDPEEKARFPKADEWADHNLLVLRILSYAGDYLEENPTLDRFAETAEKLVEDMTSASQEPFAPRHVFVRLSEPIKLTDYLEAYSGRARRQVLDDLTTRFEACVQTGIDAINAGNPCEGGKPF